MVRILEISAWGLHERILGIMGCYRLDLDDFQSAGRDKQLCAYLTPTRICCCQLLEGGERWKVEGDYPVDRLYRANVRRNGEADLFGDRRLV